MVGLAPVRRRADNWMLIELRASGFWLDLEIPREAVAAVAESVTREYEAVG
jgi:hypothetical protein